MAKKRSGKASEKAKRPNEKDNLTIAQMREWSKDLKSLARDLDSYAHALEMAGISEFKVIWSGFDSQVRRAKYLMRNQIKRQTKNTLENEGHAAAVDNLE